MKGWVIALREVAVSSKLGDAVVASGRRHGWDIERFDAFLGFAGRDWLNERGYSWLRKDAPHYTPEFLERKCVENESWPPSAPAGMLGGIASHMALWERCVESGEPIAIFEHDAELIASPPTVDFEDCLVLGPTIELMEKFGTLMKPIDPNGPAVQPFRYIFRWKPGFGNLPLAACYALTPSGAAKLLADVRQWGASPTDIQVRHPVVNMQTLASPVCTFQKGFFDNPSMTSGEFKLHEDEKAWRRKKLRRYFLVRWRKIPAPWRRRIEFRLNQAERALRRTLKRGLQFVNLID